MKENLILVKNREIHWFFGLGDTDINTLNFEKKDDFTTLFWQECFFIFKIQFIGVFTTYSNIYDGAF